MKNKKTKLISYLLASSIFLSGCKINFKNNFNDNKLDVSEEPKSTTVYQEETIDDTQLSETIEMESTTIETIETQPMENIENETIPQETTEPTTNILYETEIAIITEDTNLYSGNTTESLIISNLKINDITYKILSCDNGWTLVKNNNYIGYVNNAYLEYTGEIIETEYQHKELQDIAITSTELNFRTEPTTDAELILTFKTNTELTVIAETDNEWLLVKYNGILGYVSKKYTISILDKAKEEYPELNLQKIDIQKIVYSITGLNVRDKASLDSEIIDMLKLYQSVRVLYEDDNWYFIMTNDYNFGFVNKKYTEELENLYVIVDIDVQRLYLYNNNELYYTTPVTTGKDSTPSDIGLFEIWYKGRNEEIVPGKPEYTVSYWMPYNYNMEGLHDAPWREQFGNQEYKINGSNGCINMPPSITDEIYETVDIGTKVLVHKK